MHIPGSLSLSLSLSPPLEKRVRGEVRGGWPLSGPTTLDYHIKWQVPAKSVPFWCEWMNVNGQMDISFLCSGDTSGMQDPQPPQEH